MGLFDLFGRKSRQDAEEAEKTKDTSDGMVYSGMRVEVTTFDGQMLFIAKLRGLRGHTAELHLYSENTLPQEEEPFHVKIRGYNDHEKKAVYMEGFITPKPDNIWHVDELKIAKIVNDRAFFRLSTDIEATLTTFSGHGASEQPCRLLNISIGGVCIGSEYVHHIDDRFLLNVKLLEDRAPSAMYCQILRITEKEQSKYEYGCKFLELTEADQDQIAQNIFTFQCKKRKGSQK